MMDRKLTVSFLWSLGTKCKDDFLHLFPLERRALLSQLSRSQSQNPEQGAAVP